MPETPDVPVEPSFKSWMGSMWLYTLLRFGLFGVLWGILVLIGLKPLFGALIGLVLSVPLSYVLLAKPRARFTANLEARVDARRFERSKFDNELDPDADDEPEADDEPDADGGPDAISEPDEGEGKA